MHNKSKESVPVYLYHSNEVVIPVTGSSDLFLLSLCMILVPSHYHYMYLIKDGGSCSPFNGLGGSSS